VDFLQAMGTSGHVHHQRTHADWDKDFKDWQWPPAFMFEWFYWWCEEADPLLMLNPLWYRIMAVLSPFAYLPFYVVAIWAFVKGRNWIRLPGLVWSFCLLYSMVVILAEELIGPHRSPKPLLMLSAYAPYVVVPFILVFRLLPKHPFGKQTKKKTK